MTRSSPSPHNKEPNQNLTLTHRMAGRTTRANNKGGGKKGDEDNEPSNRELLEMMAAFMGQMAKNSNNDIAAGITSGLAKNQVSQDSVNEISTISLTDTKWRIINFLHKVSKLALDGDYNHCWYVLARKMSVVPDDITRQAEATHQLNETINKAQWTQWMKLMVYPEGAHELNTLIKDTSDKLADYNPTSSELTDHLKRATTMWRCIEFASGWSKKEPTFDQRNYHNSAYIKGLCHAIPDEAFAKDILKFQQKNVKSNPEASIQDYYTEAESWIRLDKEVQKQLPRKSKPSLKRKHAETGGNKENQQPTPAWTNAMVQEWRKLKEDKLWTDNAILHRLNDMENATNRRMDAIAQDNDRHRQALTSFTPAMPQLAQQQQVATAPYNSANQPPCRDFARGLCDRGTSCRYSHANPGPPSTPPPAHKTSDRVCSHFLKGQCKFGSNCRFRHSGNETCRFCEKPGHQYGPTCPNYKGCYRCEGKDHFASKCPTACNECKAPAQRTCMPNCPKKPVFRRGSPSGKRT
jgi:hypothetical protein